MVNKKYEIVVLDADEKEIDVIKKDPKTNYSFRSSKYASRYAESKKLKYYVRKSKKDIIKKQGE